MAKTSVLSKPLPNASLPRNSFDRSFVMNYNWSAGMLLPVFAQFVPAGSHCKINRAIFCRTADLNTAAFVQLDHFIDFFKVPLKLLMTRYNEFKLNVNDLNSSGLIPSSSPNLPPASMPYFAQSDFGTAIAGTGGTGSSLDQMGSPILYGAKRLLDLLGYNPDNIANSSAYSMNYNAFRLLAYQKVYYDHYRNTAYESNDPEAYNADYDVLNNASKLSATGSLRKALTIRYHNYRKDFFQNIYPALNYVVSSPDGTDWLVPLSVVDAASVSQSYRFSVWPGGTFGGQQSSYLYQSTANLGANNQSITAQTIRALFALDKLQRASAYAPKHVKDQLEARFGVKSRGANNFESVYLGSFKNQIAIGEVTSTANTVSGPNGDQLGAIGGKGVGGSSYQKDIEVDTYDDDCLIMGIAYTLPRSMYDALRVDSFNFKFSREDIFNPEFMDLGLRPITRQEFKQVISPSGGTANNYILGYVPRDQEYKIGIDENHGLFAGGMLDVFTTHTNTLARGIAAGSSGVTLAYFKCYPADLDDIFVTQWDPQYQITDQFYGQIVFKFISRQNMSVHGQPRL